MFNTQSTFVIGGKALGLNINIEVNLSASEADASPIPAMGHRPLVVDTQNMQTVILSALNGALIQLQHMDQKIGGQSIDTLRIGRTVAAAAPSESVMYNPEKDGKLQ